MNGLAPALILWGLTALGVYGAFTYRGPDTTDEDDGEDEFIDRRGILRRPGQEPREVGLP